MDGIIEVLSDEVEEQSGELVEYYSKKNSWASLSSTEIRKLTMKSSQKKPHYKILVKCTTVLSSYNQS